MLVVDALTVERGTFKLRDVSLAVGKGAMLAVLGPNGSGKSTLLEAIAGLAAVAAGRILIDGADCTRLPPERRRIGYLVQDYGLFPHFSVRQNVRFGMRGERRRSGFDDELLERLQLGSLADRRPGELSGGERQRVGLARALAAESAVLLFDEPFAALDPTMRPELQRELRALLERLDVASVFVTHDRQEALVLADEVAIMRDGAIVQQGAAADVFAAPADPFVARFVGIDNRWEGRVEALHDDAVIVRLDEAPLALVAQRRDRALAAGSRVLVCVHAEDVAVVEQSEASNSIPVHGARVRAPGPFVAVELAGAIPIVAYVRRSAVAALLGSAGAPRYATFAPAAVSLIPLA